MVLITPQFRNCPECVGGVKMVEPRKLEDAELLQPANEPTVTLFAFAWLLEHRPEVSVRVNESVHVGRVSTPEFADDYAFATVSFPPDFDVENVRVAILKDGTVNIMPDHVG
jgi:hypothetical protein